MNKRKITTLKKKPEVVWVVVVVESGIPVLTEAYRNQQVARRRERFFRRSAREAYDAIGVFKVKLGLPAAA